MSSNGRLACRRLTPLFEGDVWRDMCLAPEVEFSDTGLTTQALHKHANVKLHDVHSSGFLPGDSAFDVGSLRRKVNPDRKEWISAWNY